ncbi:MAG: pyridoxal-phosphate dependent enzyme, partial [Deferribacterota bacterium]|nr:pyridoxal-phosphate dependent enzyme [Deferribacterota bacterium]
CGKRYPLNLEILKCECGKPLRLSYKPHKSSHKLVVDNNKYSMWRYSHYLPVQPLSNIISLDEGFTPLITEKKEDKTLYFKLEYINPSGSFKDRGSSILISLLKSKNINEFIEDSSGNAGISYAMYAARASIRANIFVPDYIKDNRLKLLSLLGAKINKIEGGRKKVAEEAMKLSKNCFYASHVYNWIFIEGVKTIAYEIYEQLSGNIPKNIFVPTGNGTLFLGLYYGFLDLLQLELIKDMPKLYAVQPEKCAPLAYYSKKGTLKGFSSDYSIAEGTLIENPPRLEEIMRAVKESKGETINLSEKSIEIAHKKLFQYGYIIEPTAALGYGAFLQKKPASSLIILTGSGLKLG